MAKPDGSINFDTRIDTKGITNAKSTITKSMSSIGSAIKKVGAIAAAAFSVRALVQFGKEAVSLASDLQEVQNVVDVAFGEMSDKVDAWAKTTVEAFGMSELKAKQFSSTYMAMGRGMGIEADKAAQMAIGATERIADVASFYNKSFEEVDTMMKSIWTGETESLKRIGVVMTQTNLQAFALSKGIKGNIQDLDQATLTQLRYAYVMEQTALAQGDFARTSDSWANQTRLLSENFNSLKASLGQGLIQALTPAIKYLNILMKKLVALAQLFSQFTAKLFGKQEASAGGAGAAMAESQNMATQAVEGTTDAQNDLTKAMKKTNKEQQKTLLGFDEINRLNNNTADAASGAGAGIGDIAGLGGDLDFGEVNIKTDGAQKQLDNLVNKFKEFKNRIAEKLHLNIDTERINKLLNDSKTLFLKVWNDLKTLKSPLENWFNNDFLTFVGQFVNTISTLFLELWDTLNVIGDTLWDTLGFPVLKGLIEDVLPVVTQFGTEVLKTFETTFGAVGEIVRTVVKDIKPSLALIGQIISDVFKSIHNFWDKYGKPIFEGLRTAIETTKDSLLSIWKNTIKPIVDFVTKAAKDTWDKHLKPFFDNVLEFVGELILTVETMYNKIMPWLTKIVNFIGEKLQPKIKLIVNVVKSVIDGVIDIFNGVITYFKGILKIIRGIFSGDMKLVFEGFRDMVRGVLQQIKGLFSGIINAILSIVESGINGAIKAINKLLNPLRTIKEKTNIGFTIPDIKEVKLPRLATGTVVPANYGEFAAILGDNKREAEIVSPISTMKQAFKEAIQEMSLNADVNLTIEMDGDKLTYKIINQHNKIYARTGRTPLKGI